MKVPVTRTVEIAAKEQGGFENGLFVEGHDTLKIKVDGVDYFMTTEKFSDMIRANCSFGTQKDYDKWNDLPD